MATGSAPPLVEAAVARVLQSRLDEPQWLVAFSGGLDSTALLHATARVASTLADAPVLRALHVHHGLAAQADTWEAHCVAICNKLNIECRVQRVAVQPGGRGLEAAAREARYRVFRDALRDGGSLLLAHHQDDQVETFFLRLMRGSGVHGLAGMAAERPLGRGQLLRPLLGLSRDGLRDYVRATGLDWIEDPSNAETRQDRNYLRHSVLPLLEQRWPGYRAPVTRAMAHLAERDAAAGPPVPATRYNAFGDPGIDSDVLADLPLSQAADVLRHWLRDRRCQAPPRQPLLEFLRQLRSSAAASAPRLQRRDWCLQRHGGTVYLLPDPRPFVPPAPRHVREGECVEFHGVGRVTISAPPGAESELILAFRQGGERLRLPGEAHHRSLKTLLQSAGVPPWWRQRVPLLFSGSRLLSAGGLWRASDTRADLTWERVAGDHPD